MKTINLYINESITCSQKHKPPMFPIGGELRGWNKNSPKTTVTHRYYLKAFPFHFIIMRQFFTGTKLIAFFLFLFLFLFPLLSLTQTITVKQDGTGDYITINQAIIHANNNDTVLVYPGTYYENVDFMGKPLTLGSLYLVCQQDSVIRQTVIDGEHLSSCIKMYNVPDTSSITGFTLQNGKTFKMYTDDAGGGIKIYNCGEVTICHCIIKNNEAIGGGGGIFFYKSKHLTLSGNIIRNNHSWWIGGGINASDGTAYFDTIDLNSIFMNYAYVGLDVSISYLCSVNNPILLDTATVINPDYYFISSINGNVSYANNLTCYSNWGIIEQVDSDLFVNPQGDNNNDGLTPETPLKTIAFALQKIKKNSQKPNTIHLSDGIYSASLTEEKLPLCFKDSIAIVGQSRSGAIIDSEHNSIFGTLPPEENLLIIKKLTYKNGNGYTNDFHHGGIWANVNKKTLLDSVEVDSCRAWTRILSLLGTDSTIIKNCSFTANRAWSVIISGNSYTIDTSHVNVSSSKFIANYPDTIDKINTPLFIKGLEILYQGKGYVKSNVVNCEFSENLAWDENNITPVCFGLGFSDHTMGNLVNSTFCYNKGTYFNDGVAFSVGFSSVGRVYNSIFYGNEPYQINTGNLEPQDLDSLFIYYSCIQDGEDGIRFPAPYYYFYYDTTNIDKDPLFYGGAEFPYNLSDKSPCIDAGTLNLPADVELPEYDLAGNPRIFNGKIDMGAYEWDPTVDVKENLATGNEQRASDIKAAPNPFSTLTYISAKWDKKAIVSIEIYNNAGLLVNTLQSGTQLPGSCRLPWNGTDNTGNFLPVGGYLIVLTIDGKKMGSIKLVKR